MSTRTQAPHLGKAVLRRCEVRSVLARECIEQACLGKQLGGVLIYPPPSSLSVAHTSYHVLCLTPHRRGARVLQRLTRELFHLCGRRTLGLRHRW